MANSTMENAVRELIELVNDNWYTEAGESDYDFYQQLQVGSTDDNYIEVVASKTNQRTLSPRTEDLSHYMLVDNNTGNVYKRIDWNPELRDIKVNVSDLLVGDNYLQVDSKGEWFYNTPELVGQ